MKKLLKVFICVIVGVVAVGAGWFGHALYSSYYVDNSLYSKLSAVTGVLDNLFLYDYDKEKAADYAALGITASLDDPYTVYYSRDQFKDYIDSGSGDFVGIGVTVTYDKENDEILVISVLEDSPGMEAGILPGDVILKVNGEHYAGSQLNDAVSKIRGIGEENVENTSVNITVRRNDEEKAFDVVRKRIHQDTVKYEMLENNIGYIRITAFHQGYGTEEKSTYEEYELAMADLIKKGMKSLVIDVRDNGGGDVEMVSKIADSLVPEGLITYTLDKYGKRSEIKSDSNELNMPMAVLVNGNSASASELLTGCLRDYGKAKVFGTKTFGKGVMQQIFPLSDGSGITVTIAKYYTPNGVCVQDEGLTPDEVIEPLASEKDKPVASIEKNKDIQLKTAIDYLKTAK